MPRSLPTRTLREHPDLEQLKRQAKELLQAFASGHADAAAEVNAHYREADPATFALHDAQLVLARAYGFESWPKLKAYVDGATVRRLVAAIRARSIDDVRALLKVRPELACRSIDNLGMLHFAVLERSPEIVRLLMEHGANARDGVYPHREATSPYAMASQREDLEIVRIIEEQEQKRRDVRSGTKGAPSPDDLFRAIESRDPGRVASMLEENPALVNTRHATIDVTALHVAARALEPGIIEALVGKGADPAARGHHGLTPLDAAAHAWYRVDPQRFSRSVTSLRKAGAPMTASAAAALGDTDWLRARHEAGDLANPIEDAGGLLRIAVTHRQHAVLRLLLDLGFDPDERIRFTDGDESIAYSWGMALQQAVQLHDYEAAELLLARGADPNASIYASGDPMFSAYSEGDARMIALLERYGGVPAATTAGLFRQTELARRMVAGEAPYRLDGAAGPSLAEQLLWGGACGGDPEVVRLALERVDWPRDDPRWFNMLEQTLRHWSFGSATEGWDESTYLTCFRLLVERCDPDLRGRPTDNQRFGLTTLHNIVARGDMSVAERVRFATVIIDAGARMDLRDNLLKSTPLGWACRWGHRPLVELFLERGADPIEADAEPWATPRAWAKRMNRPEILGLLGSDHRHEHSHNKSGQPDV